MKIAFRTGKFMTQEEMKQSIHTEVQIRALDSLKSANSIAEKEREIRKLSGESPTTSNTAVDLQTGEIIILF